jgi:cullin-4
MGDHMFRDLALSRDTMEEYHERLGHERAAEQRLTAMVLQQSFWPFPSRTAQEAIIPVPVHRPFLLVPPPVFSLVFKF